MYNESVQAVCSIIWAMQKHKRYSINNYEPKYDQRTYGPVNAHQISWPSKAQNIQNLKNIW